MYIHTYVYRIIHVRNSLRESREKISDWRVKNGQLDHPENSRTRNRRDSWKKNRDRQKLELASTL